MKKTIFIAKNELYSLFYSPIAWILMILFIILTSADSIGITDWFLGMFERGGFFLGMMENLSVNLTANPLFGFLFGVIRNLYIFFPLITMGLISRETSSGTIKLLYSSPVKIREIVLGKYLAVLVFTLCLTFLLALTLLTLSFSITHPDYTQMLASVFGIFLVLSTYAAIGLFISSLTSYQIVAAIITLGIFALISRIGELWQDIDVVRNITYYLNIGGKSYNFVRGLMNLRDFTYFLIFIGAFLAFTIIKIKSGTESISPFKKAMRYVAVIAVAFVLGYITNQPHINAYLDVTRDQVHTITPPTQSMLAKLNDGELEVTAFANLLDMSFGRFPPGDQNSIKTNIWEPYIRFKPDLKVKFVYYYNIDTSSYHYKLNPGKTMKEIAEKEAKTYRVSINNVLPPAEVSKLVNVVAEENRCFFQLKYKGKTAIVRTFDDNDFWPFENEIAATINRLVDIPPKIAFLSDEIERGPFSQRPRDYKQIASQLGNRQSLINQGYDFDTLSLRNADIPSGLAALVLADPRTTINDLNLAKIHKYINEGGNMFIASEPDRREITKPLFDSLGVNIRNGLLVQPHENFASDLAFPYMSDTAKNLSPQFARMVKNEIKYWGDTLFRVALSGSSAMEYIEKDGFKVKPLLTTDPVLSWNRIAPVNPDSLQLKVSKLPSDEYGSFITAVRMSRNVNGREQRLVVASDADYLTPTAMMGYNPKRYNYNFGFWCFSYFSYGKFPSNTLRPESLDSAFRIGMDAIPLQKALFYWIIPIAIGISASVILIRRKRK